MTIIPIQNVQHLSLKYDSFLIDLWGVIHDGLQMYEGAAQCLQQLRAAGKEIIFISNAPRRAIKAIEGLKRFGIERSQYDGLLTSGELAFESIKSKHVALGTHYYIIGPERDNDLLKELPEYVMVDDIKDAQSVIVTGFDHDDATLQDVIPEIEAALIHKLPMLCVNPDYVVVRLSGKQALCAGAIAQCYAEKGGEVMYFGKPYPDIYAMARERLKTKDASRIAVIGDNLHTDIQGGNEQGIDTYFIASGILAERLHVKHNQMPDIYLLEQECANEGIKPLGVLPGFVWGQG